MAEPNLAALTSLCRLRHIETDAARRVLGEAVSRETALATQTATMELDIEEARQISGPFDRQAFAAWFERMLDFRSRLADAMREAEAHSAMVRTSLAQRRVAETAAEEALANAVAARAAEVARQEQLVLEDVARALKMRGTP